MKETRLASNGLLHERCGVVQVEPYSKTDKKPTTLLIGGRQTGKTSIIVNNFCKSHTPGRKVLLVHVKLDAARELRNKLRNEFVMYSLINGKKRYPEMNLVEKFSEDVHIVTIDNILKEGVTESYDAVYVEEAAMIFDSLFGSTSVTASLLTAEHSDGQKFRFEGKLTRDDIVSAYYHYYREVLKLDEKSQLTLEEMILDDTGDFMGVSIKAGTFILSISVSYLEKTISIDRSEIKNEVSASVPRSLANSDVNGAKKNISDLVVFGNGDMFKLLCKASSVSQNFLKSTKAMEIPGLGCVVQVTTREGDKPAEAVTFVPGAKIVVDTDENGVITGRHLEKI
ncbi:MAG: hypothetical protein ACRC92_27210 [Peptostreptococcaceae bacterium]